MELNRQQQRPLHLQKAYLISLCLQAQRVLAENTGAGDAIQQKALLDQVLAAFTEPSADHLQIYIGIGLLVAVIVGIVMTGLKGEATQKVTFDDVADAKPRKRAGLKKPEGSTDADATSSSAASSKNW